MATVRDNVLTLLGRLARLEVELGVAETKALATSAAIAGGVGVVAAMALIAALVVLAAAAIAPLFAAPWAHLVVVGGGVALLAILALLWSVKRLRSLPWPHTTLTSVEENWQWLGAQLRSRLTSR